MDILADRAIDCMFFGAWKGYSFITHACAEPERNSQKERIILKPDMRQRLQAFAFDISDISFVLGPGEAGRG